MPKKRGSVKASEKAPESPDEESEKPSSKPQNSSNEIDEKHSSKPKKSGNEIDEIFAGKKRKKPEAKKSEKLNEDENAEPKLAKRKKDKKKNRGAKEGGFLGPTARPQKKTEDGLVIYTEEELGISNPDAGNTPLCPFDCSCCF